MGSTFLGRPCKPWLRTHRDTSRVNESPREAREHASGSRITVLLMVVIYTGHLNKQLSFIYNMQ